MIPIPAISEMPRYRSGRVLRRAAGPARGAVTAPVRELGELGVGGVTRGNDDDIGLGGHAARLDAAFGRRPNG